MRAFKKKSQHNARFTKDPAAVNEASKAIFEMDFQQYIGQTVTVFVNAGGEVGKFFSVHYVPSIKMHQWDQWRLFL
ncbi:MAG: hypothetical protein K0R50_4921 [Eubacterium sp.]|nr:hypothetical protein [Eubacterium sp.]